MAPAIRCACATAARLRCRRPCHFVVFVNPVAHASTDRFFTFCDEHLTQECDSAASACDSGTSGPCHRSIVVLTDSRGAFFRAPTLQESCGSHCRRDQSCCEVHHLSTNVHPTFTEVHTVPYHTKFTLLVFRRSLLTMWRNVVWRHPMGLNSTQWLWCWCASLVPGHCD